jgi:hypothetical protein
MEDWKVGWVTGWTADDDKPRTKDGRPRWGLIVLEQTGIIGIQLGIFSGPGGPIGGREAAEEGDLGI